MNFWDAIHEPVLTRARAPTGSKRPTIIQTAPYAGMGRCTEAEKLSAVYACINIRSGDIASLPYYLMNRYTKERAPDDDILYLLNVRPNVRMTPQTYRMVLERSVAVTGNAYDWIIRDPRTRRITDLIPLTGDLVYRLYDTKGNLWYQVTDPVTKEVFTLPQEDVCDYKDETRDGVNGISVLSYASEVVGSGLAAQAYNKSFYENGGQPSGILTVEADLSGNVYKDGEDTGQTMKDAMRDEWEHAHGGAANAHKIAILDHGLKYQSLAISQKDAMFVEQYAQNIADVARFFNFPLYKLQAGKQSYNANEQNAIEYARSLLPRILQREQERTYKLLSLTDQAKGWQLRVNMMALERSDPKARAEYYREMKHMGAYSTNDIRSYEDLPDIEGGDEYEASLNYVPQRHWAELSQQRAGGKAGTE